MSDSTEIEPITTERLIAVMAQVVEEYGPDYIYSVRSEYGLPDCFYVPRPEFDDNRARSGCLIGEILARTGHLDAYRPVLATEEPMGIHGVVHEIPTLFADRNTLHVASIAQAAQDSGETWGQALDYARRTVAYLTENPNFYTPSLSDIKVYQPPAA